MHTADKAGVSPDSVYPTLGLQDSGDYVCTSRRGYSSRVRVEVSNTTCPELQLPRGATNTSSTAVATPVQFSCRLGFTLQGSQSAVCREDGRTALRL